MNKTYCLIDIGTNNVLLLLAQTSRSSYSVLKRLNRVSALGADMKNGILHEDGITRLKEILLFYIGIAGEHQAKTILIGTSALREAVNAHIISDWLKANFNLELLLISGEEEARCNGLANLNEFQADNLLLFDIGGGSTELTSIKKGRIADCLSLNLGIRKLYNLFDAAASQQQDYVKEILAPVDIQPAEDFVMAGIGGTVTSLAAILRHLKNDRNAVHGYLITLKELDKLLDFVIMIPEHRVLELLPFNPVGKSFLLTGGMIVREIIARFSAHSFFVSDRTWQYGVLQEIITGRFEI